MLQSNTAAFHF